MNINGYHYDDSGIKKWFEETLSLVHPQESHHPTVQHVHPSPEKQKVKVASSNFIWLWKIVLHR